MPRIIRYRMIWKISAFVVMALYWLNFVPRLNYGNWTVPLGPGGLSPFGPADFCRFWVITVVMVLYCVVPGIVLDRWVRREKNAVAQGKRPCLHCGCNLQGRDSVATCPECGTPFDIAEIERYFIRL